MLAEGLTGGGVFPDYLDALDRVSARSMSPLVRADPLRVYAMGERAIRREPATAADIALMRALTQQAVQAGAFGFTTSRTNAAKTVRGEMVPGRFQSAAASAPSVPRFWNEQRFRRRGGFEFDWITRLGRDTGRPVWFLLTDRSTDPARWRRIMAGVHGPAPLSVTAQNHRPPVGVILGIATSLNPFSIREQYRTVENLHRRSGSCGCATRHCARRSRQRRRGWRGSGRSCNWSRRSGMYT